MSAWGAIGAIAPLGALALRQWAPSGGAEGTLCLFRRTVGLPCPGCGMTRAFAALARGDWWAALQLHPFAYLLALELGALWLVAGWWIMRRGELPWRPPAATATGTRFTSFVLIQVAAYLAFWTGRVATGTLPW